LLDSDHDAIQTNALLVVHPARWDYSDAKLGPVCHNALRAVASEHPELFEGLTKLCDEKHDRIQHAKTVLPVEPDIGDMKVSHCLTRRIRNHPNAFIECWFLDSGMAFGT